jgi:hypothetical protein
MARKQQGAERRPCFCLAFGCTSLLLPMVTGCIAVASHKDNDAG